MRQVFIGWGVAVKRKAAGLLTIYFPHPLLHMRTSHNVEGLITVQTCHFHSAENGQASKLELSKSGSSPQATYNEPANKKSS